MPRLEKSKETKVKPEAAESWRDFVNQYGKCVRQRSVRQETTMAKAGTLPEFCYMSFATQSHDPVVIDKVAQPSNSNVQDAATNNQLSAMITNLKTLLRMKVRMKLWIPTKRQNNWTLKTCS